MEANRKVVEDLLRESLVLQADQRHDTRLVVLNARLTSLAEAEVQLQRAIVGLEGQRRGVLLQVQVPQCGCCYWPALQGVVPTVPDWLAHPCQWHTQASIPHMSKPHTTLQRSRNALQTLNESVSTGEGDTSKLSAAVADVELALQQESTRCQGLHAAVNRAAHDAHRCGGWSWE